MVVLAQQDFTYLASSTLLFLGYALFLTGVITPAWRTERGYTYGLWEKCHNHNGHCTHAFIGFREYLTLVRCLLILALLALTTALVCLLTEMGIKTWMRRSSRRRKHLARLGRFILFSAPLGEILAAGGLALYGYKAVLEHKGYPVLLWGVAVTGAGVIFCQLASIMRVLGPIKHWERGLCCLAPPNDVHCKLRNEDNAALELRGGAFKRQVVVRDVNGVAACCAAQWSDDSSTLSLRSFINAHGRGGKAFDSDSLSRHYRQYEEISFHEMADMPPPPPELLTPPPVDPQPYIRRQPMVPYPNNLDYNMYCNSSSQPLLSSSSLDAEVAALTGHNRTIGPSRASGNETLSYHQSEVYTAWQPHRSGANSCHRDKIRIRGAETPQHQFWQQQNSHDQFVHPHSSHTYLSMQQRRGHHQSSTHSLPQPRPKNLSCVLQQDPTAYMVHKATPPRAKPRRNTRNHAHRIDMEAGRNSQSNAPWPRRTSVQSVNSAGPSLPTSRMKRATENNQRYQSMPTSTRQWR